MLAISSILLTAIAGFVGAPAWTALIGAAVLFSISYHEQRKLAMRFAYLGITHVLTSVHWQSAGYALLASGAAYGAGVLGQWALHS